MLLQLSPNSFRQLTHPLIHWVRLVLFPFLPIPIDLPLSLLQFQQLYWVLTRPMLTLRFESSQILPRPNIFLHLWPREARRRELILLTLIWISVLPQNCSRVSRFWVPSCYPKRNSLSEINLPERIQSPNLKRRRRSINLRRNQVSSSGLPGFLERGMRDFGA